MRRRSTLPARVPGAGLILAVVAAALSACGTTEPPAGADTPRAGAPSRGPVTYTDERGEHTLPAPASDVVSLEWGLTENLVALGVEVAGQADVEGYNTWDTVAPIDPDTPDVGTRGEPSLDAIAALDPDLVVTTTDLPEAVIDQIDQIAPVLVLRGSDATDPIGYLRSTLTTLGQVTDTQDAAAKALATFDRAIADNAAAIAGAGLAGASVAMADGWITNGTVSIRMYTPGSYLGAINTALGLKSAWTDGGDPDYGLAQTDVEGLSGLGDLQFLYVANDADGADPFADGLADNAIWRRLPFVAAGNVHRLPDGIWLFGGPLSGAAYADAVTDALT